MHARRRFWPWLVVWTLLGLGIRVGTVLGRPGRTAGGDPAFYYYGAKLLVQGKGFINSLDYMWFHHEVVKSAPYAPGYMVLLTVPIVLGFKTFYAARMWSCVLSAAAIVVAGFAGKEIGGRRVGLIAALLIALDPNMWMPVEMGAAETIEPLVVAAVLLCAYRFWKQPDVRRAIWFGVVMGLTMLCRDELTLLVLFIMVPMCLLAKALSWKRRFAVLGVGLLSLSVVIGPWVGYNMVRFEKPTFISTGAGITMASADCPLTFSGEFEGYWAMVCALNDAKHLSKHEDESAQGAQFEHMAITFLEHHENRLFPVTLAKEGRAFGFFHPLQQISFDAFLETRPYHWALVGLGMYYALLVLSIPGTLLLRRARIPVYPLWAIGLNVAIAVAITFGNTRYRLPFDVATVMMGSVALAWAWGKMRPERAPAPTPPEEHPLEAPVPVHA